MANYNVNISSVSLGAGLGNQGVGTRGPVGPQGATGPDPSVDFARETTLISFTNTINSLNTTVQQLSAVQSNLDYIGGITWKSQLR